ncbi:hypothetical protein BHYA_0216g00010 [Botrytis hyacinthi]|uniref:Uncharacterized protein n=1 Tax=Botrytis hyacinthi TaxID=278943 RepID=A0A4Z1GD68_9HELO|nr:hypothetical protein BHYA_0216g00010 [Botrytis hyacinthi]
MKHQSSTSTASPISLSPDVERRIEDPEVRRVFLLFIKLGQTDIIKCLNKAVKEDSKEEFTKILEAVCLYVKRGLRTQDYLTAQMLTDAEPCDWLYNREVDEPFTPTEKQLMDKFGTRWPTLRGAIDMFSRELKNCVERFTWKTRYTKLTYRIWHTIAICPNKHPWDQKSTETKSKKLRRNLRLQVVVFYPGLVNLAFLRQDEADELIGEDDRFDKEWEKSCVFREKVVSVTRSAIKSYGSVDDAYTDHDKLSAKKKLAEERRIMLDDFDAQKNAFLNLHAYSFDDYTHVSGWYKCEKFWVPANPIGSVLNTSKMMVVEESVGSRNLVKGCSEVCAMNAVREYGIGYVPRPLSEIPSEGAGKDKRGLIRRTLRMPPKQESPSQNSQHRGSSRTRTGSHGKQERGSYNKRAEENPPARKSSKKPDPHVVSSSSRTSGSGATPRRHG